MGVTGGFWALGAGAANSQAGFASDFDEESRLIFINEYSLMRKEETKLSVKLSRESLERKRKISGEVCRVLCSPKLA